MRPRMAGWGRVAVLAALAVLAAACGAGAALPVELELVTRQARLPLQVTHAGDGSGRLFIVEKEGTVRILADGAFLPGPFLDLRGQVSGGYEQGLLGLAFHPRFPADPRVFVNYTDRGGDTVVASYRVAQDRSRVDPASRRLVLRIDQPAANHNAGMLAFGPDGYLYVGTGDGGRAGDPWGNGQNPQSLLGKMLRIDVDGPSPYGIPPDNPFARDPRARPEIWALGLRNPWRYSFDRATGDLYIADVGQGAVEEVNFQSAASRGGENYGWNLMEGRQCYPPGRACTSQGLVPPVAWYGHREGCSITGGYVYRGREIPELAGRYLFGDYCSGTIWSLRRDAQGRWQQETLLTTDLRISSFGEDEQGELYVTSLDDHRIYRLRRR